MIKETKRKKKLIFLMEKQTTICSMFLKEKIASLPFLFSR